MATAYVSIGPLKVPGILDGEISRSATVTTSGTSALSSITAGASEVAIVFCETAVYARSGGTATAAIARPVHAAAGFSFQAMVTIWPTSMRNFWSNSMMGNRPSSMRRIIEFPA